MGFDEIIGYENEKKEIAQLKSMLLKVDAYRRAGIRLPRGVILCGAPGIGKSVMARSLAGNGIALIELRAADCCEDTSESIRMAFEKAKQSAPSVLLLDELDKIAGTSNDFFMETNDSVKKILIQEMDNLSEKDTVLVAATCNDMKPLGNALTRPGRFDHILTVELPDMETRKDILAYYLGKIKIRKECSVEYMAKLTGGFSCADLECICNEAGIYALDNGEDAITTEDMVEILDRKDFTGSVKDVPSDENELRRIAVHEAGHVLVALELMPECVYGASILPQGMSLGHVRMLDTGNGGKSEEDLLNTVCVTLAGRTAEKREYGQYFLGSENDLNTATDLVMNMLLREAFISYKYLIASHPYYMNVFPDTAAKELTGDFEQIMGEAETRAKTIMDKNEELFRSVVGMLMERKALTREELLEMKNTISADKAA